MIKLEDVGKDFDSKPVLAGVSFTLERSRSYALIGQNGSGKTTLLSLMAGLSKPTRGRIFWGEKPLSRRQLHLIGTVMQAPFLYGDLTGLENLVMFTRLFHVRNPVETAKNGRLQVGLSRYLDQPARTYSKGMRQRLSLARALLHDPELLLLDEPFDGLDTRAIAMCQALLRSKQNAGATIFMVTHQHDEAMKMDTTFQLRHGRLTMLT